MKGYLKILLVLLLAVGLASCEDDRKYSINSLV